MLKIMGFWLQLGVDGFRMDAVPFVISQKGPDLKRPVEHYEMLRSFTEFLSWRKSGAMILGEANVTPSTTCSISATPANGCRWSSISMSTSTCSMRSHPAIAQAS